MARISTIFTESTITQVGATVLNPLREYINVDASKEDPLTPSNITETVDSLFYMQAGDKTPFTTALKVQYDTNKKEFTYKTYDAVTKISVARSNNQSGYYNNPLTWGYNAQGNMSRTHDDENTYDLKAFKRNYPYSSLLGGYPLSNYDYKTPRISTRIYYLDPATDTTVSHNNYTTPYDFINNKSKEGKICHSIMFYYTGFASTTLCIKQDISGTTDGEVSTFAIPYSNNVYWDFWQQGANPMYSTLDFTNKEYFDDVVHIGTGTSYNYYVHPIKPEKILNFIASFGFIFNDKLTKDELQTFYPIVNNGIISGEYVESPADWTSDNSKWGNTDELDKPDPSKPDDGLAKQPLNPYALAERFFNRYLLTAQEMIDLKAALDGETLQELNAIQYVVNLCIVPDGLDTYYASAPTNEIYFGKTAVNLPAKKVLGATSIISMGRKNILPKYNNFLDYEPYTKVSLYIPFCGKVSLPTDKVMGKQIRVQVAFDYLDGNCTAYVYVGESLITTSTGNFYCSVPLSQDVSMSKDMEFMFSAINWIGQSVGSVGIGLATQNPAIAIGGAISSTANFGNSLHDITAKSDTNIVQGSGNLNAFNAPMECCVYYERPDVEVPKLFGDINGFACHESGQLKEFHGFTSCSDFHLDGIVCTKIEKEMLEELLRKGVILD